MFLRPIVETIQVISCGGNLYVEKYRSQPSRNWFLYQTSLSYPGKLTLLNASSQLFRMNKRSLQLLDRFTTVIIHLKGFIEIIPIALNRLGQLPIAHIEQVSKSGLYGIEK